MKDSKKTGIYFHRCPNGSSGGLDFSALEDYAKSISEVSIIWNSESFPLKDHETVAAKIKESGIEQDHPCRQYSGNGKTIFCRSDGKIWEKR